MSNIVQDNLRLPVVRVSRDRLAAEVTVGVGTVDQCIEALTAAGVKVDEARRLAIMAAVECGDEKVVMEGFAARNGEHGRVDWEPGMEPPKPNKAKCEESKADYYASRFITVAAQQVVATVVPPTLGEAGEDVCGRVLEATDGRPFELRIDETMAMDDGGRCTARVAGVLRHDGGPLGVMERLVINGYVDFATGSVDVQCDVEVAGGVRDMFVIDTPGSVLVRGLVEAATICTGGDFDAPAGMAAKFKGSVTVGGDFRARYLNNVHGWIKGRVTVELEIINCMLDIAGALAMERGSLIASVVHINGPVHVAVVGSDGGELTTLALGSDVRIEQCLEGAQRTVHGLYKQVQRKDEQLAVFSAARADRSGMHHKEIVRLEGERTTLVHRLASIEEKRRRLLAYYRRRRCVEMRVDKMLHHNTRLIVDDRVALFRHPLKGPLWIGWDAERNLVIRNDRDGSTLPVEDVAEMTFVTKPHERTG